MQTFGMTHPGKVKPDNQDRYLIRSIGESTSLFVLADGMGGESGGELAAQLAIAAMERFDATRTDMPAHLIELSHAGHASILSKTETDPALRGMGTTLIAAYVEQHRIQWAYTGDSRLYLFSNGHLNQLTHDHNIPGVLFKNNEITEAEMFNHPMKNVLLKSLGGKNPEPETGEHALKPGDRLIFCSDGLHDEVPKEEIEAILQKEQKVKPAVQNLLEAALSRGGSDNITIIGVGL